MSDEFEELYEMSKDDQRSRMIVGSEVRNIIGVVRSERARISVLEADNMILAAEIRAWHAAEHLRKNEPHNEFMTLAEARAATRSSGALERAKRSNQLRNLSRNQICGCVICVCEDEHRCHGCGAKHCGKHEIGKIPNAKFEEKQ